MSRSRSMTEWQSGVRCKACLFILSWAFYTSQRQTALSRRTDKVSALPYRCLSLLAHSVSRYASSAALRRPHRDLVSSTASRQTSDRHKSASLWASSLARAPSALVLLLTPDVHHTLRASHARFKTSCRICATSRCRGCPPRETRARSSRTTRRLRKHTQALI